MHAIDFHLPQDVLGFLEKYANPNNYKILMESPRSVSLFDPQVDRFLEQGNFPQVLTCLWKETDLGKRHAWLESKSPELHPILMYELAIVIFSTRPSQDTLSHETFPLLDAARFRLYQEAECSLNLAIKGSVVRQIHELFRARLSMLVYKRLKEPYIELELKLKKREFILPKVHQVAQQTIGTKLSSPLWIGWCGMNIFSQGRPLMIAPGMFQEARNTYASDVLTNPLQFLTK